MLLKARVGIHGDLYNLFSDPDENKEESVISLC